MRDRLEQDVRFLKRYAIVSTLAFGVLAVAAFRQQAPAPAQGQQKVKFTEIDVERINVVEPNGMYRMVISNRPRSIGPIYKGKPFGYAGGSRPGIIFFNDEGTENGGLTFTGSKDANGRVRASTHMSFDQFNQDQILNLDYSEDQRGRVTGISVLDRASVDIYDMVAERDSIQKAVTDTAALRAALMKWAGPRNGQPLAAQRMFVGRDRSKSALMALSDPQGKVRLRLAVDSLGTARIEFLDADGKVTRAIP
ncbi:MAG: hypothetical protein ACRENU_16600 [Gemmatimonadaceae bacterium]